MRTAIIVEILALAVTGAVARIGLRDEPRRKGCHDLDPLAESMTLEPISGRFEVRSTMPVLLRTTSSAGSCRA